MRLYKMELYKLCHRKSFLAGFLFVLLIGLLFFYQELQHSYCVVNGTTYTGLRAIQMNRQITEEFKGVLTDEKAERIIEKYGFPQGAPDDYSRQKDNFLNHFIMEYASDGYNNGQDDYRPATKTIPLRETELGRYHEAAGMALRLEYYSGWSLFPDTLGILMLGASMLVLYVVSVVFSEEEQTGMKPLLFTTREGPAFGTLAKIAAAFSVSAGIWFVSVCFGLLLHITTFGIDGLGCIASLIVQWGFFPLPLMMQPVGVYLAQLLLVSLLAILELCAITICISAHCRSPFHTIVAAGIFYTLPFLGFALLQTLLALLTLLSVRGQTLHPGFLTLCAWFFFLLNCLLYSSPVYLLVARDVLIEIALIRFGTLNTGSGMTAVYTTLGIALMVLLFCTINACRRYRRLSKI